MLDSALAWLTEAETSHFFFFYSSRVYCIVVVVFRVGFIVVSRFVHYYLPFIMRCAIIF
jgi:hypothetical protein